MILVLKNMQKKYRSNFSFEKHGEKCRFDFSSKKSWRKKCRSDFCFENNEEKMQI